MKQNRGTEEGATSAPTVFCLQLVTALPRCSTPTSIRELTESHLLARKRRRRGQLLTPFIPIDPLTDQHAPPRYTHSP